MAVAYAGTNDIDVDPLPKLLALDHYKSADRCEARHNRHNIFSPLVLLCAIMKLVIVGATGLVAQELIRQSLPNPDIKSIVAVARRSIAPPVGAPADKVKSVLVTDFDDYPDEVKKEFAGADACIWSVG